ncbi:hypothetical protein M378DRAFT_155110 [Amanita muscaria Koide BX008]|uniref:Uncharacterized protein n=1 Tax=Amanita muscaria (strain Koide BX008) TaxID=946122 RepID=A0A0C2XPL2_AMAMK|nr:hypothetical protein M378DRAFT_155110 [Amanita muscaria Koide BX008]
MTSEAVCDAIVTNQDSGQPQIEVSTNLLSLLDDLQCSLLFEPLCALRPSSFVTLSFLLVLVLIRESEFAL